MKIHKTMNNITRNEISDFIHYEFGLAKKDCNDIVNHLIEEIVTGLQNNNKVKIHNFGTFKIMQKNARKARNPKTREEVIIPPRKVISFIPSKKTISSINNEKSDK